MNRSGLLLLLSAGITSALGLAYWLVAARILDEATLGRGAALVSAMLLATSIGTSGLKRGIIRFVPVAGPAAQRLVTQVYGVGIAVTVLIAGVVIAGANVTDADLPATQSWWGAALFVAGCAIWGLFVLQDSVLVGAGRTTLVPTSNAVFSVLKILALLALFALASAGEAWELYASWIVPAAIVAFFVNRWLFRHGLRRHGAATETDLPPVRALLHFAGAEYVATLLWQAAVGLTPLIIVTRAGADANAHYYVAYQIAYALFLVPSNVGDALVAEGARSEQDLVAHLRHSTRLVAAILVPGVALAVVAAPRLMALFGESYGEEGASVLALLALASVPYAISTILVAVAHVHRRMRAVVLIQGAMAASTLALTWVLVSDGVEAVALGWLLAQSATAALAIGLTLDRRGRRRLRAGAVGMVGRRRGHRPAPGTRRQVRQVLRALPDGTVPAGPVEQIGQEFGLIEVAAGPPEDRVTISMALDRPAQRRIARRSRAVDDLVRDRRTGSLRGLLPTPRAADPAFGWMVEQPQAGGVAGTDLDGEAQDRARSAGVRALRGLHDRTVAEALVTTDDLDHWVHGPVTRLAGSIQTPASARGLAVLHRRLASELDGRVVTVARCHGAPAPERFDFTADGQRVVGIAAWEASGVWLPDTDLIWWMLAWRRAARGEELGDSVRDGLVNGWRTDELASLGPRWSSNDTVRPTTLLLLTWLHHVGASLEDGATPDRRWLEANVDPVLVAVAEEDAAHAPDDEHAVPAPPDDSTPSRAGSARSPLSLGLVRAAIVISAAATWLAWAGDLAPVLRALPVLATVLLLPAYVLARALAVDDPLVRVVVAGGGAGAAAMVVSEVLIYAGAWSPGSLALAMGALALAATVGIPRYASAVPSEPAPPLVVGHLRTQQGSNP